MEGLPDFVRSVIYRITCVHPDHAGAGYVGQTRTHVLNHGKYRVFGAEARWRQHVSEARVNHTQKQSWKLNNAIRKYGEEFFAVEVLGTCAVADADRFEQLCIRAHDSLRSGLNLRPGGKAPPLEERARLQIARTLCLAQDGRRLEEYKDVEVESIRLGRRNATGVRAYVRSDGVERHTDFYGRHATLEDSIARAKAFALVLAGGDLGKVSVTRTMEEVIGFDD